MNTKQLWTALTLNPKTNFYFDGIFSIDTLKEIKEKPDLIICNTDPSNQPGEHWVLFFFNENSVLEEHNQLRVICVDIIVCIMLLLNVMVFLWKKLLIICFLKIMWWSL